MNNLPPISELVSDLEHLKDAEDNARLNRIRKEQQILDHPEVASVIKDEGSVTVDRLGITTGYTRKWDQKALAKLHDQVAPEFWPFKTEFKEDRAHTRRIEESTPELWEKLREALTLNPKKPGLTIKKSTKKEAA